MEVAVQITTATVVKCNIQVLSAQNLEMSCAGARITGPCWAGGSTVLATVIS